MCSIRRFQSWIAGLEQLQMNKIKAYIEDAFRELIEKVSWPTWSELQSSAIIVMVASFIIAVLIFVMDASFRNLMGLIYKMFY